MFDPCFVMQYLVSFLVSITLMGKERSGCFTIIVFLMSCDCLFLWLVLQCVIVALPDHAHSLLCTLMYYSDFVCD